VFFVLVGEFAARRAEPIRLRPAGRVQVRLPHLCGASTKAKTPNRVFFALSGNLCTAQPAADVQGVSLKNMWGHFVLFVYMKKNWCLI